MNPAPPLAGGSRWWGSKGGGHREGSHAQLGDTRCPPAAKPRQVGQRALGLGTGRPRGRKTVRTRPGHGAKKEHGVLKYFFQ